MREAILVYILFILFHGMLYSEEINRCGTELNFFSENNATETDNLQEAEKGALDAYIESVQEVRSVIQSAVQVGNFLSLLDGEEDLLNLPVVIETGDPLSYQARLIISDVKFKTSHAELSVIVELTAPQLGETPLILAADGVKYSSESGFIGDVRLRLGADYPIPLFNKMMVLLRKGEVDLSGNVSGTYVQIGCGGVENLAIGGEVIFSRDWLIPDREEVHPRYGNRVVGSFTAEGLTDFRTLYLGVSINSFQLTKLKDFRWTVKDMILDLSEVNSPDIIMAAGDQIIYPVEGGVKSHYITTPGKLWKGFYMESAEIELPDNLSKNQKKSIKIENLIIDDGGLSGQAIYDSSTPLLNMTDGDINGWGFSIDNVMLTVTQSTNWAVGIGGLLYVPLLQSRESEKDDLPSEEDAIHYTLSIDPENGYLMVTELGQEVKVDLMLASAKILPTSSLTLGYSTLTDDIVARGKIDADILITGSITENSELKFPKIGVRDMIVQSEGSPLILNLQKWVIPESSGLDVGIFTFNLALDKERESYTSTDNNQESAAIDMNASVVVDQGFRLTGQSGFRIGGALDKESQLHKWKNNDFSITDVTIGGTDPFPGVSHMYGNLIFYKNHEKYGSGFRGRVDLGLKSFIDEIKAIAQFGSVIDGNNQEKGYFFIDCGAEFRNAIPIMGPIGLKGIGGGFYKNMTRPSALKAFDQIEVGNDPHTLTSNIGKSLSGVRYEVASNYTFGFKASTLLMTTPVGTGEEARSLISANLEFGMQFGNSEGTTPYKLESIYLQGIGKMFDKVDPSLSPEKGKMVDADNTDINATTVGDSKNDLATSNNRPNQAEKPVTGPPVSFKALFNIDFKNNEILAILGIYLDAGIFYGKAVAEFYARKRSMEVDNADGYDWHFFIGQMYDPVRLGINIPLIGDIVQLQAYLMAGNQNIPTDLPEPLAYNEHFGSTDNSNHAGYPGKPYPNSRAVDLGKGIALGMSLSIGTPDKLTFLFMYATLQGGMGFDILMVKDQNKSACYDESGTGGWLGKGQAWAYVFAEIGARANFGIFEISFQLFEAAAGAALRVEGPDPFYAMGRLDARLSLFGLASANIKFKVEVGSSEDGDLPEDCQEEGLLDIPIIQDVIPETIASNGLVSTSSDILVILNINYLDVLTDNKSKRNFRVIVPGEKVFSFDVRVEDINNDLPSENNTSEVGDEGEQDEEVEYLGFQGPTDIEFERIIELRDISQKDIPYTTTSYDNEYGQTTIRITPDEPLPSNAKIYVNPSGYLLEILEKLKRTDGPDGNHVVEIGYKLVPDFYETPKYEFETMPLAEDYIIHDSEVSICYPIKEMKNFHIDQKDNVAYNSIPEEDHYWIMLKKNNDLVYSELPSGYKPYGRIVDSEGEQVGPLLSAMLREGNYGMMITFSKNPSITIDREYVLQYVVIREKEARELDLGIEKILYEVPFKTSKFRTFAEKMSTLQENSFMYTDPDSDVSTEKDEMTWKLGIEEGIDEIMLGSKLHLRKISIEHYRDRYEDNSCQENEWLKNNDGLCSIYNGFSRCVYEELYGWTGNTPYQDLIYKSQLEVTSPSQLTIKSSLPGEMYLAQKSMNNYFSKNQSFCDQSSFGNSLNCLLTITNFTELCSGRTWILPEDVNNEKFRFNLKYHIPYGLMQLNRAINKNTSQESLMPFELFILDLKTGEWE